jgi:PadR family transcriptional regulator, regulatory protein AphA
MKRREASHSILGALSLEPMSGYDIQKFVTQYLGYFWKESYGQIYPMLKRMAGQRLVEVRVERNNGKPDRQVYSLTAAGRNELEKWLSEPAAPPSPRNEILLKLFFSQQGNIEDMIAHVEELRARHEELLSEYEQVDKWLNAEQAAEPGLPYWLMTLNYGKRYSQMVLEWCGATQQGLRQLEKHAASKTR